MRAALMKGEGNLIALIIPVESVLHLIAIVIVLTIGRNLRSINIDMLLTEEFNHQLLLELQFVSVVNNLPRRSGEVTAIL